VRKFAGEIRASAAVGDVELVDGRVPNRIMLLPIGELQPRDGRKPWRVEDRAHAEDIVQATQDRLGKTSFMVDYDHQAHRAPAVAGRAVAAGWIEPAALRVEEDGIYGDVEWTATARAELKDRQYRYISPEFGHTKDGRVTRLFTASLTNTPALEMSALASSHGPDDEDDSGVNDMKKIITQLGLAEGADEDAIVTAIASLQASTSITAIATALSLQETASAEEVTTAATAAAARPDRGCRREADRRRPGRGRGCDRRAARHRRGHPQGRRDRPDQVCPDRNAPGADRQGRRSRRGAADRFRRRGDRRRQDRSGQPRLGARLYQEG
jgi:phage I-like protein